MNGIHLFADFQPFLHFFKVLLVFYLSIYGSRFDITAYLLSHTYLIAEVSQGRWVE